MKKCFCLIIFLALVQLIAIKGNAQDSLAHVKSVSPKLDVFSFLPLIWDYGYAIRPAVEYNVGKRHSLSGFAGFGNFNNAFDNRIRSSKYKSYQYEIGMSYRYYFNKKPHYPRGLYLGTELGYEHIVNVRENVSLQSTKDIYKSWTHILFFGGSVGYQGLLMKRFVFDVKLTPRYRIGKKTGEYILIEPDDYNPPQQSNNFPPVTLELQLRIGYKFNLSP